MVLLYIRRRLTHALQNLARYLGAPPASPTPLTSEWISTRCEGLDASAAVVEVALDEESGENGAVARVALGGDRLVVKRPPASPAARAVAAIQQWYAREAVWKSKFYGAFVLNLRVDLHAIDATPARWRGDAGSSPLDGASTATSSPRISTRRTGWFPHR